MASRLRTRVLGKRVHLKRVDGWVRQDGESSRDGLSLDTGSRRLPLRIPGRFFRDGQRLSLVAVYRGRGRRRAWALWSDPGSGLREWITRPAALARRLRLAWRPLTPLDALLVGALVWAVAVRGLRLPALYAGAAAWFGEAPVHAVLDRISALFHGLDRLLVRLEWMRAYERVFDHPVWLGAGVVLAYAALKGALLGLSLGYSIFRLRRAVLRASGAKH
ncbi:hypothetical protein [Thiohalorhabdus methylotrophus]|uniref:DUF2062 domain-containing protein n=1 Tax=Thiohalorhabdus methylotrophus TaxID=3242694 RepID=A0ABV4TTG8_9GAMM